VVQAFVVDPSVLIQGYIQDAQTAHVQSLLKGLTKDEPTVLHVPEFCLLECTNILWKQVRFHGASVEDTRKALTRLNTTPLTVHPARTFLERALSIGLDHELAVYDSIYIALAETLHLPLITVDARQIAAAQKVSVVLKSVTDFPPLP
jgi:predicted nucleic acid-binding protein